MQRSQDIPWLTLVDANGRVGSVASPAVGPSTPEAENGNGSPLRLCAEDFHLRIRNVWGTSGFTWTSTRATTSRIDYVLVPEEMHARTASCEVDYTVDLTVGQR